MRVVLQDKVWQTAELTQTYLEGVRGAIPQAELQIEVMLRLIEAAGVAVTAVLDLGCGDGILGQLVLDRYPAAQGVFLDFSAPMLAAAAKRLASYDNVTLIEADYGRQGWEAALPDLRGFPKTSEIFDVIVSGYSIHHQPDERKRELYAELFNLLRPGGIFINIEHVVSHSAWGKELFDEMFIDALYGYHQQNGKGQSRAEIAHDFYNRPDKEANILAPVETQCDWLRQIGFERVDCYQKLFELAVFGGVKPLNWTIK
jgi:SAM-dependent methyltransferase